MAKQSLTPYRSRAVETVRPANPLFSFYRQANRMFEDAFRDFDDARDARDALGGLMAPSMDVTENDSETRITAELPGVKEEDVDVMVEGDMLSIRAEKRVERADDKDTRHVNERAYGTFQRSIRLPQAIDPDQVRANFDHGVLTVTLPRAGAERDRRRIAIESGPPPEKAVAKEEVRH